MTTGIPCIGSGARTKPYDVTHGWCGVCGQVVPAGANTLAGVHEAPDFSFLDEMEAEEEWETSKSDRRRRWATLWQPVEEGRP